MIESQNTHGGKRQDAGRKSITEGVKRETFTLVLPPDIIQYLRSLGRERSHYVERLIREDIKLNEQQ